MTEWFEEWFGEEYLDLYPHRDDAEAEQLAKLLRRVLPWPPGIRVLDVGCGAGRHARALEAVGARVTGLDLSACLLRRAHQEGQRRLVRADMRALPVRPGSMDLTVNLFTSFGYFATDRDHASALSAMVGTVRSGGWFAIDFLHAATVISGLVPSLETTLAGTPAVVTKQLLEDRRYVLKTITLGDGRIFTERVRLFTPIELERMLQDTGLVIRCRFGDYAGGPMVTGAPRTILVGERAA
jgi:SAM-dependent methyltransferase